LESQSAKPLAGLVHTPGDEHAGATTLVAEHLTPQPPQLSASL